MAIKKVTVSSVGEIDSVITGYLAQGFIVANRTPTSATLQKKKEFKVMWAVIGFILCLLPLLIYLLIYAMQPDVEIVEISVL
jgi:hypothetical protein